MGSSVDKSDDGDEECRQRDSEENHGEVDKPGHSRDSLGPGIKPMMTRDLFTGPHAPYARSYGTRVNVWPHASRGDNKARVDATLHNPDDGCSSRDGTQASEERNKHACSGHLGRLRGENRGGSCGQYRSLDNATCKLSYNYWRRNACARI
jgi:hypothetical protein